MSENIHLSKDESLLPCPFCGASARIGGTETMFYVACDSIDCYCCVGESYDRDAMPDHSFASEHDAIAAWNRRAAHEPLQRRGDITIQLLRLLRPLAAWERANGSAVGLDAKQSKEIASIVSNWSLTHSSRQLVEILDVPSHEPGDAP